MNQSSPIVKDIVLVGGGHSHVAVLKKFGMDPLPGVRLTVISRDVHPPYSGMLPGYVAGYYDFDDAHIDLRPLCQFAGARLFHDRVVGIDLENRRLQCAGRPDVAFDVASINIGATPRTRVPGADEYALPVKPVDEFLEGWQRILDRLAASPEQKVRVVAVGGGAGGCELLLSAQYRIERMLDERGLDHDLVSFAIINADERLLAGHNGRVSAKFERIMGERGVRLHLGHRVTRVDEHRVHTDDGAAIPYDELLWVTGAGPAAWLEETGLATTDEGFLAVNEFLQSVSTPYVFAAGDVATMVDHPRPKSGVFAVRAGKPLAENLRRYAQDRPLKAHRPQKDFLSLIGTGDPYAVGSRGWFAFEGEWVWKLKQWIDTNWMEKWRDLPRMEADAIEVAPGVADERALEEISAFAMRCGGCGAKVGATILERVLERLAPTTRDDVLVGLDSPDDCAVLAVPEGQASVQTVDFFRAFIDDPYLFGRIAANHAMGDLWAMGAAPQAALALATLPYAPEEKLEESLFQLMSGALSVLEQNDTALVGGHTGEGPEMAFGLQVTGLGDPDALLRKSGMRPGDRLVLTKPVGTGTLFAADMRQKARGRWIDAALETMAQSNRRAAEIVIAHGATACTDITGFGVLGHLAEMTRASRVHAAIVLDALPLLDGALECVSQGIFSSLQPQNIRLRRAIANQSDVSDQARYPLLFDPQTAGGLLASVPADDADACVRSLKDAGYAQAAIIGRVEKPSNRPSPIVVQTA